MSIEQAGGTSAARSIARTVARSDGEWGRLYRAYSNDALRFAFMLTNDLPMAEDLMQEAFVKVFSRFGEKREPRSFVAYLRRTILNLARSQARRRRLEHVLVESARSAASVEVESPESSFDGVLWEAVQDLPLRQRSVIFFRYHLDMKEEDVAEAMGCSVGAVKSLMLRAKRTLQREIEEERWKS